MRGALDGADMKRDGRARYSVELVFEEIVGNLVRYGAPQGGDLRVAASVEISGDRILMMFEDNGVPFDPSDRSAPATLKTLAEAPDGGFGLNLVHHVASSMRYERAADQNRLVVTLPIL